MQPKYINISPSVNSEFFLKGLFLRYFVNLLEACGDIGDFSKTSKDYSVGLGDKYLGCFKITTSCFVGNVTIESTAISLAFAS